MIEAIYTTLLRFQTERVKDLGLYTPISNSINDIVVAIFWRTKSTRGREKKNKKKKKTGESEIIRSRIDSPDEAIRVARQSAGTNCCILKS